MEFKNRYPIYLWQAHDAAINQMQYQSEEHLGGLGENI